MQPLPGGHHRDDPPASGASGSGVHRRDGDAVCAGLRRLWGTENTRTLPLSTIGSGGMEAAFVNFVHPGDVVVVGVNGLFGERMVDVATRMGAEVVRVDFEWGSPVDPVRLTEAHPNPQIIAVVYAETSTGVRSDIAEIGRLKGDALLLVDAVTAIAGIELEADRWGIDIGYAGTQKCLGVAPGLAPFTVSERAWERRVKNPRSWYLDLGTLGGYVGEATGAKRTYHHPAPTGMVVSLGAAIDRILDEGLGNVIARHAAAGEALQVGLEKLGLELFAEEGSRLPDLTTVKVPEDIDSAAVRTRLLEHYDIEIGAGVGAYADNVWRIGLMGPNAQPSSVPMLLGALEEAIAYARS
ncbi:pyridoxal-phosphate-dependent aminotransferase family protein [Corynebacterium yudongzhengii]|uniref:pyridoxal-phosphate-dependent aminotransferase family protein n=1 Tax=Corynebacterium yudongzhengii TaxID=2080740 RepID=UPI0018EE655B|nr:aminotransferase class V-fold PLP-dependent enzyme [Corynebacterium yudongzhengii]